jgi:hypothetical protein
MSDIVHSYDLDQFIDTFSRIRQRPKADSRQIQNLTNELLSDTRPIHEEEAAFASRKADLISINPTSVSPLVRLLEAVFGTLGRCVIRAKVDEEAQILNDGASYSSDSALTRLATGTIISLGLVMLLSPMWWLEFVENSVYRLAIITGFLALFMIMMSAATVQKPFEVVAASAAYGAVLMVFMQIQHS